jgi:hypothetical protein
VAVEVPERGQCCKNWHMAVTCSVPGRLCLRQASHAQSPFSPFSNSIVRTCPIYKTRRRNSPTTPMSMFSRRRRPSSGEPSQHLPVPTSQHRAPSDRHAQPLSGPLVTISLSATINIQLPSSPMPPGSTDTPNRGECCVRQCASRGVGRYGGQLTVWKRIGSARCTQQACRAL